MPKALSAGLGRPQVEKIHALVRAAREFWCHLGLGDEKLFDEVFGELCRRHDCAEWDNQLLRTTLENELAVESENNQQVIHLALETQIAGNPFNHLFDRKPAIPPTASVASVRPVTQAEYERLKGTGNISTYDDSWLNLLPRQPQQCMGCQDGAFDRPRPGCVRPGAQHPP